MSLPRFLVPGMEDLREGALVELTSAHQVRRVRALRLKPGDPLELALPAGIWRCDIAESSPDRTLVRVVAPLEEGREVPVPIHVWLPVTAQLSLMDEMLPPLVELGATLVQPVTYARSEHDPRKSLARMERWDRIIRGACEQSHRTRVPDLRCPVPFDALLSEELPQKWVAYEGSARRPNPVLELQGIAITSGPEGGIADGEFDRLLGAGWVSVSLGFGILRAVTAPAALLGAVQYELQRWTCPQETV